MNNKYILATIILSLSVSLKVIAQVPNYVPTNGLMGWWPFDGNGNDISGSGNNLNSIGSVSYTVDRNGVLNSCALFNSSNEYFSKSNVNLPSGNASRTIAIWFNGTGTTYNNCPCNNSVPLMYGDMVNGGCYKRFGFAVNSSLNSSEWLGKCNPRIDNINSHLNSWHQLVYTYNSSNNVLELYQDGVLMNSSIVSGTNATTLAELRIGSGLDDQNPIGNVSQFDGKIDDVGIWNRVLSSCEIFTLYNSGNMISNSINAGLDQNICLGSQATLNATNGLSYSWSNSVTNGVAFTPNTTTTYTVTGTNSFGCVSTDQVVITVNDLPIINAGIDQILCEGQSTSLSGSGALTYSWNNGVQNGVSFVPSATSDYTVIGTDANGCIGTDTVSIVVNNNSTSTLNETVLDSYTLNGQTYTQSGTYIQVIPNAVGCDSTITLNLSLNFTGINELETIYTVAPNPTSDIVTITSTEALYDKYVLFDPVGRKVLSGKLNGVTTEINLSDLSPNAYQMHFENPKATLKIIKF